MKPYLRDALSNFERQPSVQVAILLKHYRHRPKLPLSTIGSSLNISSIAHAVPSFISCED